MQILRDSAKLIEDSAEFERTVWNFEMNKLFDTLLQA